MDPEQIEGAPVETGDNAVADNFQAMVDDNTQPADNLGQQDVQQTESNNPAWQPILDAIPEGFRNPVIPKLQEWERGVNAQFQQRAEEIRQAQEQLQRFTPYQPFVEQGYTPEQIAASMIMVQELASDPQAFYQKLGEHYGFAQAANPQQAQEEVIYDANQVQLPPEVQQQLAQQQEFQQQVAQFFEQQQQEQIRAESDAQIDRELADLDQQFGLSPVDKREVLQRAIIMSQTNPNVTLMDAYKQWDSVKREMFAQRNSTQAPAVLGTSGSSAPVTPTKRFSEMSGQEQKDDLVMALKMATGQI